MDRSPSEDDERRPRRLKEAMERVLRAMPPSVMAETRKRKRPEAGDLLWATCWLILLLLALLDIVSEHSGYLPWSYQTRLRALIGLGAFGMLIVFPDRVADWLQGRLQLARGIAPRLMLGIGLAGFGATWYLGSLSGVVAWRGYPLVAVLSICIVRRFLAWADRTFD